MRERISVIGWTRRGDRPRELAEELDADARIIFTRRLAARPLLPARYLACALIMVGHLARRRPQAIIVVNPPLWPALIGLAYCRIVGARLYLDSHPGGFGAQGHRIELRLQSIHRFLVRRAEGVLVTTEDWVEVVEEWGGTARIVHEPPRPRGGERPDGPSRSHRPVVLFICIFAPDEPVEAVLHAAREVPEADWWITGDPSKASRGQLDGLPPNVRLTGYLEREDYDRALGDADVILALTTEPTSVMRAAYEAVYARRPLVVSDFPALTATFPFGTPTANEGNAIACAVRSVLGDLTSAKETTESAYRSQVELWNAQAAGLQELLGQHAAARR